MADVTNKSSKGLKVSFESPDDGKIKNEIRLLQRFLCRRNAVIEDEIKKDVIRLRDRFVSSAFEGFYMS